ncbi:hypothetical protein MBOVb_0820 [Mycoplasmopsis bovis 1067]|nr:hypothetical protein MBOVb_0820 [Mycoplasmopsis bovis 1067]
MLKFTTRFLKLILLIFLISSSVKIILIILIKSSLFKSIFGYFPDPYLLYFAIKIFIH